MTCAFMVFCFPIDPMLLSIQLLSFNVYFWQTAAFFDKKIFAKLVKLLLVSFVETGESVLTIKGPQGRINRAVWGPLNKTIISAGEDAVVRIWDSEVSFSFYILPLFSIMDTINGNRTHGTLQSWHVVISVIFSSYFEPMLQI